MSDFHWAEVDGVATLWTEAPSPLRAGLLFRAGYADETLPSAGQTHLIEHMALARMTDRFLNSNGSVDALITGFYTMGSPNDVCTFLAGVCEGLTVLPADRLEAEKQILAAEFASHPYDVRKILLTWRYGAAGHGLFGMPELGCREATLEQLQERRMQHFTRGNAVLWLSGPLPHGLRLDLPAGEKKPPPPLTPVQSNFPGWFVDDTCGGVAAGATVPRVAAATLFCAVASRRLLEKLRTEQAVSYTPSVFYDPLRADTAHLVLYADSDKKRRLELAKAFGEAYERLTEINDAEVEAARGQIAEQWTGSMAPPAADRMVYETQRAAFDWLFGRDYKSLEFQAEEMSEVSTAEVAEFARGLKQTAMIAVPGGVDVEPWMGQATPYSIWPPVKGRKVRLIDAPVERDRLVYGPEGVSVLFGEGSHLTVLYSELSAAMHYEDGCLRLVGRDATWLVVEPTLWRNGASVCREICDRIPAHLLLEQGPRSAEDIPKPKTTAWQRFRHSLRRAK
jgi:zinc protease